MSERSVLRLHLRWSVLRIAAPILAAIAVPVAVASAPDRVITAPEISAVLLRTFATIAPVMAAIAAWDGLRERRGGGGFLLDSAARPSGHAALIQATAGIIWTSLVWAAPLAALLIYSWLLGSLTSPPQILNLAVLVALVAWLTGLSYLLAFTIRHWAAVLAAGLFAAVLYGVATFPVLGVFLTSLNPFTDRSGNEFLAPTLINLVGVLVCLLGVAAVTLSLFTLRRFDWTATLAAATGVVLAVCGGWVVALQEGHWGDPVDVTDRLVTLSSPGLTLRVLPPYVALEADLMTKWQEVQAIFADTPAAFSELVQDSDSHPDELSGFGRLYLQDRGDVASASVAASLIDVVTVSCGEHEGWVWTFLMQYRIAGSAGYLGTTFSDEHYDILTELEHLSTDELSAWMAENYDGFVSCTLTAEDLPA